MKDDLLDRSINRLKRDSGQARAVLFIVFLFVATFVWILWGGTFLLWSQWAGAGDTVEKAGSWGDSFGPFNALVSALGFTAVLSTLILQNIALKEQQRDQHLIRFDATFFELLKLLRELRAELVYTQSSRMQEIGPQKRTRKVRQSGFDAIKYAYYEVAFLVSHDEAEGGVDREGVARVYMSSVHQRFESRFAPYFRIIYTILNKIKDDKQISESQKEYYGNLLRAQLTSHEIALLGFNATASVSKDLDSLLIFFRMFKYLPEGPARSMLADIFPPEAFAART